METGIYIVTGAMASGKSTVAELLARRLERAVHLRGDTFRRMIVKGREEMLPEPSDEALRQLDLRYRLTALAADGYYEAGFAVIVQDIIVGPALMSFISNIKSRPVYLIVLAPNEEAIARREAQRSKKGYGVWTIEGLSRLLQQDTPRVGLWLDSSTLTPEQTADEIERRVQTEGMVHPAPQ
ncbi:phosphotransferase [Paenibacillus sp. 1011MAR3C5]|uniref:AAA family ATPase n=1 Tax=Paenibacillus sp. 1011MAR3C5 TaxID=1675787 RepID=UPI000E6B927E|nr:AAA family ATPase [Paenibacillus sp. 1011MAR3C5]RJE86914.1 phosphotransferase [Paenibacillus sp. 1011MAR3C5]